jgi:hypothetical protein
VDVIEASSLEASLLVTNNIHSMLGTVGIERLSVNDGPEPPDEGSGYVRPARLVIFLIP